MEKQQVDRIVRKNELLNILSVGPSKLYDMICNNEFPPPVRIGGPGSRAVGWRMSVVQDWIEALPQVGLEEKAA